MKRVYGTAEAATAVGVSNSTIKYWMNYFKYPKRVGYGNDYALFDRHIQFFKQVKLLRESKRPLSVILLMLADQMKETDSAVEHPVLHLVTDNAPVNVARPGWEDYFLDIADAVAKRASCHRLSVGAVFVSPENHILATGFNGAPKGMPHCIDEGCLMIDGHCKRVLHAERNAIMMAAKHGIELRNATCYITHQPCSECTLHLIQIGVKRVLYRHEYKNDLALQFASEGNIELIYCPHGGNNEPTA